MASNSTTGRERTAWGLGAGKTACRAAIDRSCTGQTGNIPGDVAIDMSNISGTVGRMTAIASQSQTADAVTSMNRVAASSRWSRCRTTMTVVAIVSHGRATNPVSCGLPPVTSPVAMAIDGTGRIVNVLLNDGSSTVAGDKSEAIGQVDILRHIQAAADDRGTKSSPVGAVDLKAHLNRITHRRHGVALVAGITGHGLTRIIRMYRMSPGACWAGASGCRRIVYQSGGGAAINIVGYRRVAMTTVASASFETLTVQVTSNTILLVLMSEPVGIIGSIVVVIFILAVTTFANAGRCCVPAQVIAIIRQPVSGVAESDRIDTDLIREFVSRCRSNLRLDPFDIASTSCMTCRAGEFAIFSCRRPPIAAPFGRPG